MDVIDIYTKIEVVQALDAGEWDGAPFVTIHRDRGFQGQSQMLRAGRFDVGQLTIGNDSVSSIRVLEGWEATLYHEPGLTGSSLVVTADKGYIGNSMENRTSSIIVKSVLVPPITPPRPTTL